MCLLSPFSGIVEHNVKKFNRFEEIGYIECQLRRVFSVPDYKKSRLWISEKAQVTCTQRSRMILSLQGTAQLGRNPKTLERVKACHTRFGTAASEERQLVPWAAGSSLPAPVTAVPDAQRLHPQGQNVHPGARGGAGNRFVAHGGAGAAQRYVGPQFQLKPGNFVHQNKIYPQEVKGYAAYTVRTFNSCSNEGVQTRGTPSQPKWLTSPVSNLGAKSCDFTGG